VRSLPSRVTARSFGFGVSQYSFVSVMTTV
jgi:hypothetical protein